MTEKKSITDERTVTLTDRRCGVAGRSERRQPRGCEFCLVERRETIEVSPSSLVATVGQ